MANLFEAVADRIRNSYIVIWIFFLSVAMLLIGLNHFAEDTYSSYMGIQWLQESFGLIPASWDLTYWTMSVAPQVAQVIFGYMFIVDMKNNRWAFWAGLVAFLIDFGTDIWYRSNQGLFTSPATFLVTCAITFAYFTIGSEGFVTVGLGLVIQLLGPFIVQTRKLFEAIGDAITDPVSTVERMTQSRPSSKPKGTEFRNLGGRPEKNATFQDFFGKQDREE